MKLGSLILFTLIMLIQSSPAFAVKPSSKTLTPKVKTKDNKFQKKLDKWKKRFEKWTTAEDGIVKNPRPLLAMFLAIGGAALFVAGISASFALAPIITGITFIASFLLSIVAFLIATTSLRIKKESEEPLKGGFFSGFALVISGLMLAIFLLAFAVLIVNLIRFGI